MASEQEQKYLLKRVKWAFQNREVIIPTLTEHQDDFLRIVKGFVKGFDSHIYSYDKVVTVFDAIGIPSAEQVLAGYTQAEWKDRDSVLTELDTDSEPTFAEQSKKLLKRLEWAIKHVHEGNQGYISMQTIYSAEAPHEGWNVVHEFLDGKGIPLAEDINSGFDKNNMEVHGQAFPNTVDQLKAGVECAALVEAKIQTILSNMDISLVWDRYNVSEQDNKWIVVIRFQDYLNKEVEDLTSGDDEMYESFNKLKQLAADGDVWIGFGSPEVALASAMVDFRRDQLRELGLHA